MSSKTGENINLTTFSMIVYFLKLSGRNDGKEFASSFVQDSLNPRIKTFDLFYRLVFSAVSSGPLFGVKINELNS